MTGLYFIALNRIKNLDKSKDKIIRFPKVFKRLCSSFQIKKDDCWDILITLREFGFIDIVKFQGIRIRNPRFSN